MTQSTETEPWATRYKPKTWRERALVWATLSVYREQRAAGKSPDASWDRATNLIDEALVRPVQLAEAHAAEVSP